MDNLKCRTCNQPLKRQGNEYYCPTCRLEIPLSELGDIDYGDDGAWVEGIESRVDLELAIKRLPEREQKIARLLLERYNWREIKEKERVGSDTIKKTIQNLQVQIAKKALI